MKRNIGIITVLVGFGLIFKSFIFSSGSYPDRTFIGNISRMEVVLKKGKYVDYKYYDSDTGRVYYKEPKGPYEVRIAIPLKYPLFLSVVLILVGTGVKFNFRSRGIVQRQTPTSEVGGIHKKSVGFAKHQLPKSGDVRDLFVM
jgi:hypothetical protein